MGASTSAFVPMAGKQSGSLEGLVGSTEHEMIIHGYEVLVNGLDVLLPQSQVLAFGVLFAFLLLPMLAFAADDDSPKVVIPSSKEVSLETKDGVVIKCTYYGGARGEEIDSKATVPVILLHGWQGNRIEMDGFAEKLRRTINPKTKPQHSNSADLSRSKCKMLKKM